MTPIEKVVDDYIEKFGSIPMPLLLSVSGEELEKILRDCLKTGRAYEFDEETKKLMADPNVDF